MSQMQRPKYSFPPTIPLLLIMNHFRIAIAKWCLGPGDCGARNYLLNVTVVDELSRHREDMIPTFFTPFKIFTSIAA